MFVSTVFIENKQDLSGFGILVLISSDLSRHLLLSGVVFSSPAKVPQVKSSDFIFFFFSLVLKLHLKPELIV